MPWKSRLGKIGGLKGEQAEIAKKAEFEALMHKFMEIGVELERGLIRRFASAYGSGQFNTTNDLSEIKKIGGALQSYGPAAVDPLCNLGDKKAIPAIKKFASKHSSAKDVASEALRKLGSTIG